MLFEHITPSIIMQLVNKFPDSLIINGVYLTGLRLIKEKPKINGWKIARFITIQGKMFLLFLECPRLHDANNLFKSGVGS